jgi:hypothetical protein
MLVGIAELNREPLLSPTSSAVLQLAKTLPYDTHEFSLFCDNLFSKPELFSQLKELGIGACGTARQDVTKPLFGTLDNWKVEWGTLYSQVDENKKLDPKTNQEIDGLDRSVLISVWQDNNIVRFCSTIHDGIEWAIRCRKKPRNTSTMSIITKKPFINFENTLDTSGSSRRPKISYVHRRYLPIPGMVNDYNHFMGGVDIADQYRARFCVQQRTQRNWLALFYWLLDTTIINAFLLSEMQRKATTTNADAKKVRSTHLAFREDLVQGLITPYKATMQRVYITQNTPLPVSRFDLPAELHQKAKLQSTRKCLFCRWMHSQHKEMMQKHFFTIGGTNSAIRVTQTKNYCSHCQVSLCTKCFESFHSFKDL